MGKTVRTMAAVVLMGILTVGVSGSAAAGPASDYAKGAVTKLGHGLAQVIYAPADLIVTPVSFAIGMDRDARAAVGFGFGLPGGALNAGYRMTAGLAEVFTCPFVYDPTAARPFSAEPMVTGWNLIPQAPSAKRPVQVAQRSRPSGD